MAENGADPVESVARDSDYQLNRRNYTDRLALEAKMLNEGGYFLNYLFFFILYLSTVGTFQNIANIAQVHQTLAARFTPGLKEVSTVDSVMEYMQHFIETSYEMASALVDANTMNDIDPNRCFDLEVGDVCRLSFWSVPLIDRTKASWVNITRIKLDRIGQHQVSQSFWNNCEMRLCDWATTPCGGNQSNVFPQFKSTNYKVQEVGCLYLPFHEDPLMPNGTTFGLTPEDPMILDSLRDFPYKSVVPLSPVVYQQRAQVVPCSGFGNLYNDDVLGAGYCSPEEPCDPDKVTSFTASRNNPYTERQQRIYVGYVEAAFPCGDGRLEDTSEFMDKSWFPAAGFRHLTEGKPSDRGLIDGKNVFYKFTSDTAYLQQPLNGSQMLCGIGLKTFDPDDLGVPGPGLSELQRCIDCAAGDLETPGGRACERYAKQRVATSMANAMSPLEIIEFLIAEGSTLVPQSLGGIGPEFGILSANGSNVSMTLDDFEPMLLQVNHPENFSLVVTEQEKSVTEGDKSMQYNWMSRTIADPMQNRAHEMWCDGESGVEGCHFKNQCLLGAVGYPEEQCDIRARQAEYEDAEGYAGAVTGRRLWSRAYLGTGLKDRRNTFVSLATRELAIMALVITPQGQDYEDIATLARVTFKFTQHGSIKGTWEAVSVSQLPSHWGPLCMFTICMCLVYVSASVWQIQPRWKENGWRGIQLLDIIDIIVGLATAGHLVLTLLLPEFPSNEMMAAFAANDQAVYFSTMAHISKVAAQVQEARQIGSIIAYFLFLRFVSYLTLHPRIAVMVDTMRNILDDVIHFFITGIAIFATLAFQAFWAFGMDDPAFESYTKALWTQFQMLVGDFPWPAGGLKGGLGGAMQFVYLFIFAFLVFFILLNFFLAIVVEAFSDIKKKVAINRSEMPFVSDVFELCTSFAIRFWFKYPNPTLMLALMRKDLREKLSIGHAGKHKRDIDFETFVKCNPIQPNAVTAQELFDNAENKKGEKAFKSVEHAFGYLKWYYKKVFDREGYGLAETHPLRKVGGAAESNMVGIIKMDDTLSSLSFRLTEWIEKGVDPGFVSSGGAAPPPPVQSWPAIPYTDVPVSRASQQKTIMPLAYADTEQVGVYESANPTQPKPSQGLFGQCCMVDIEHIEPVNVVEVPPEKPVTLSMPATHAPSHQQMFQALADNPAGVHQQVASYTQQAARLLQGIQMLAKTSQEWGAEVPSKMRLNAELERVEAHVRGLSQAMTMNSFGTPQFAAVEDLRMPSVEESVDGPDRADALMAVASALSQVADAKKGN
jgi:hypothetical protein